GGKGREQEALDRGHPDARSQPSRGEDGQIQHDHHQQQEIRKTAHRPALKVIAARPTAATAKAPMRNCGMGGSRRRAMIDSTTPTVSASASSPPSSKAAPCHETPVGKGSTRCTSTAPRTKSFSALP